MNKKIIFLIFLIILSFFILNISTVSAQEKVDKKEVWQVRLFIFHSKTCLHCKAELAFLDSIKNNYPSLKIYEFEVSSNFKNQNLFRKVIDKYKDSLDGSVPVTLVDNNPIVGFKEAEIKNKINYCLDNQCNNDFMNDLMNLEPTKKVKIAASQPITGNSSNQEGHEDHKKVSIFGKEICLDDQSSTCALGVVLGLADGINPCMFSVLLFLLTYLLAIGSKKKALKAGVAFTVTTFVVYFLFMLGIIKIIKVLEIAQQIRYIIIFLSFVIGLIMIKDFFFYGKWFSLEISSKVKPMLEALTKKGTIFSAIVLAALSSLVELPCTSGLPLAYVSVLSSKDLPPFGYLLLYNFFFVLPLLFIIFGVTLAWTKIEKIENWRQKSKKYMRLVSGVLLLAIGFGLLFNII